MEDFPQTPRFAIERLGPARIDNPLAPAGERAAPGAFVDDGEMVLYHNLYSGIERCGGLEKTPRMELAGPRRKIFFDPSKTRAGIVTCGGLCPGLNDVIRGLVRGLYHLYGVRKIYGFRYGFQGFIAKYGHPVANLDPDAVDAIHEQGGSILASSRGEQDIGEVVDCLDRMDVNLLFAIGGDGTLRGALEIIREIGRRALNIAVVGIPKTIDNDIQYIDTSFGFRTAAASAVASLRSAHNEAKGAPNGIGLVKLMGRHSGFIACSATLASSESNFTLIPEMPFRLDGPGGFLAQLEKRLERRGHALVVAAEGAGQDLLESEAGGREKDASGNVKLKDVGVFLRERIAAHFKAAGKEINLKYIDPSYIIRSVPASPDDNVFCGLLARDAVHAAMTGRTAMVVGNWSGRHVHVPMETAISERKTVDPHGALWRAVLETTGQPPML